MNNLLLENFTRRWQAIIADFKTEIASLRANRVTPALVDDVQVESYGSRLTLKELASINVVLPNILLIDPWDKSQITTIEKAIVATQLGISPSNDGRLIRLVFPPLTEEKRQTLAKVLKQKAEQTKIRFRQERDGVRKEIQDAFEKKEIYEDERYTLNEKLQKQVDEFNFVIEELVASREKEIMIV